VARISLRRNDMSYEEENMNTTTDKDESVVKFNEELIKSINHLYNLGVIDRDSKRIMIRKLNALPYYDGHPLTVRDRHVCLLRH
jgi:hypothetical protein